MLSRGERKIGIHLSHIYIMHIGMCKSSTGNASTHFMQVMKSSTCLSFLLAGNICARIPSTWQQKQSNNKPVAFNKEQKDELQCSTHAYQIGRGTYLLQTQV
jgi:hypothetical protein